MKVFTSEKIRAIDLFTIENEPVASVMLMERAAERIADWISNKIPPDAAFKIFVGPGNNGGDGWALARLLNKRGYIDIELCQLRISEKISHDAEINRNRLLKETKVKVTVIESSKDFPSININDFVIDALFGSGLLRPLDGIAAELVNYINESRKKEAIAIDIPSGLFSEDNSKNNYKNIIRADHTISFEFPKVAFFFPENANYVGTWTILPIGLHSEFIRREPTVFHYIQENEVYDLVKRRERFSHKGTYGHALLIAGSYGMMGAAVLAARAAIRAGAGLLTSHIPKEGLIIIQTSVPESLISIDHSDQIFTNCVIENKYSAIGIGPSIGQQEQTMEGLISVLTNSKVPVVIDADAINILSYIDNYEKLIPEGCILTPHPKEFERLFGTFTDSFSRLMFQQEFSIRKKCIIVLKGAYTCITVPNGNIFFNSTGNPGMATGGSGDVLTGLILGLVAQGYSAETAAIMGVFIHGRAGDEYIKTQSQHSLIASDLINNIGSVFNVLEKKKNTK